MTPPNMAKAKFSIYLDETIKGSALKSELMDIKEFYANHNSNRYIILCV